MASAIPSILVKYIADGQESNIIDLKLVVELKSNDQKEEFAKDICAIANSDDRTGYIIIGVADRKNRKKGKEAVPGIMVENEDSFEHQIESIVDSYIVNPPEVSVDFCDYEGKRVCLVIIRATSKPHYLRGAKTVLLRRGSHTMDASIPELLQMSKETHKMEADYELCAELIRYSNDYMHNEDMYLALAKLVINRVEKALPYATVHETHKFHFLLARSYFMMQQFQNCIDSLDTALELREDARYRLLRAQALLSVAKPDYESGVDASASHDPGELVDGVTKLGYVLECVEKAKLEADIARDGGSTLELKKADREISEMRMMSKRVLDEMVARISELET